MANEGASNVQIQAALHAFGAEATLPDERRAALSALSSTKFLPKGAADPFVDAGRKILVEQAKAEEDPAHRLLAIAECMRLAQMIRRWQQKMIDDLKPAFEQPLPNMQLLDNSDDRLNLARACSHMDASWLPEYLTQSIAEEAAGEKARAELVAGLVRRSESLSQVFAQLGTALNELRLDTQEPGDTMARRLTRIIECLRPIILDGEVEAGDGLGRAVYSFVSSPLSNAGKPRDGKVRLEFCQQVLQLIHDIVRTRMSMVTDPSMYRAVSYCRRLNGSGAWPKALDKPVESLIMDVTEALLLLGRQGQRDQPLLQQLDVLCNNAKRARMVAQELARKNPDLPEHVRDWLVQGHVVERRQAGDAAIEAAAANADESIGLALQAAGSVRALHEALGETLLSNLELYAPDLSRAAEQLLTSARKLVVHTEHAATLRKLELHGVPGEEVDVSEKFFEIAGSTPRRRMTVKQPAIVKRRSDGSPGAVVAKGLVE